VDDGAGLFVDVFDQELDGPHEAVGHTAVDAAGGPPPPCRKAKAELNQLGVDFEAVDIVQNTPSRDQLLDWIQNSDFELKAFFNTSGLKYRELGLKEKVPHLSAEETADLLSTDGMLIKRPLLVRDNQILQIGYRKAYEELGL